MAGRSIAPAGLVVPNPARAVSEIASRFRNVLIALAAMSGVINLLYLTGSLFMLQVYDRVIPSRSVPTLVALTLLTFVLYVFQAGLDFLRSRILVRMAGSLDVDLTRPVFGLVSEMPLRMRAVGDGQQPLRDLDSVRGFLMGSGLPAFFDLPWIPIYLFICFLFHPLIGWAVLIGALLLSCLAIATEFGTREPTKRIAEFASRRAALAEAGRRNAEVVRAMGMLPGLTRQWTTLNDRFLSQHQSIADVSSGFGSVSKVARMMLQSGVLALGAFLVIHGDATAGVIIASSILSARALAPVELAIANWRGFISARQSAKRLFQSVAASAFQTAPLALPAPTSRLTLEHVHVTPPGAQNLVVQDVSFELMAGRALGVIGPSASGKSSLIRAIVGAWAPARGKVRLDNAALDQWDPSALGQHVGYLPQDVELFAGTIAENISRFSPVSDDEAVIAAARAAGVHDLILRLPEGYGTPIGEGGTALSAGQRQRVGLARALYGAPFLVVLDEPNSNLDQEGEIALGAAIRGVRERGGIAIVVAHRSNVLADVDLVLLMIGGRLQAFGPRDEVLQRIARAAPTPLTVVGGDATSKGRA